jgi:hypothetical protein
LPQRGLYEDLREDFAIILLVRRAEYSGYSAVKKNPAWEVERKSRDAADCRLFARVDLRGKAIHAARRFTLWRR